MMKLSKRYVKTGGLQWVVRPYQLVVNNTAFSFSYGTEQWIMYEIWPRKSNGREHVQIHQPCNLVNQQRGQIPITFIDWDPFITQGTRTRTNWVCCTFLHLKVQVHNINGSGRNWSISETSTASYCLAYACYDRASIGGDDSRNCGCGLKRWTLARVIHSDRKQWTIQMGYTESSTSRRCTKWVRSTAWPGKIEQSKATKNTEWGELEAGFTGYNEKMNIEVALLEKL